MSIEINFHAYKFAWIRSKCGCTEQILMHSELKTTSFVNSI